ncbi:hypothetical protein [Streptomyces catenulae]|uniref:PPPDE domain-containing protein n=1 Tax=Streptomyces catenulae TaxID=66875 RepID=A0ABV2Z6C0_9ACTN|nr:hypothetical protein [Streptomyces catenulae]
MPLTPAGVRALQRRAGNAATVRALAPRPVQRAESETEENTPRYRIQLQSNKNSRTNRLDYWTGGFGHAWVALYKAENGFEEWKSYGFFPAEEFPRNTPLKTVRGEVKQNLDDPGAATSKFTAELTREQFEKAKEYIRANKNHPYNLARFNCTTFARNVYRAATGASAPGLGLPLLENPNTLQDSIKRRNERGGIPRKGENITAAPGGASDSESDDEAYGPPGEAPTAAAPAAPRPPAAPTPGRFALD